VSDELRVTADGAVRIVTINRTDDLNVVSKHLAQGAIAIVDYGPAAEALELGADDHIEKVREFLGTDKYDAIDTPEAGHEH
jgi:hypothetical protein